MVKEILDWNPKKVFLSVDEKGGNFVAVVLFFVFVDRNMALGSIVGEFLAFSRANTTFLHTWHLNVSILIILYFELVQKVFIWNAIFTLHYFMRTSDKSQKFKALLVNFKLIYSSI